MDPFFCAVHFWAPTFKWGISIANIADFSKPPEKLSYPQQIGRLVHLRLIYCYRLWTSPTHTRMQHACLSYFLINICMSGTPDSPKGTDMHKWKGIWNAFLLQQAVLAYIVMYWILFISIHCWFLFSSPAVTATGVIWSRYSTVITPVSLIFSKKDCFLLVQQIMMYLWPLRIIYGPSMQAKFYHLALFLNHFRWSIHILVHSCIVLFSNVAKVWRKNLTYLFSVIN